MTEETAEHKAMRYEVEQANNVNLCPSFYTDEINEMPREQLTALAEQIKIYRDAKRARKIQRRYGIQTPE